jgi:SAM-dependent methyltransferase
LFSSADIDSGTRLLLKVFSRALDGYAAAGKPLPCRVLDAGCGAGTIGICAAKAIGEMGGGAFVRAQDRDELARQITSHNAAKNGISESALEAFTEPLLAGTDTGRWDLILSNIPAKAGASILKDFARRSTGLLNPQGRGIMVVVHTLADFFRQEIAAAGACLEQEEAGTEHVVFVYGKKPKTDNAAGGDCGDPLQHPLKIGPDFVANYPFYHRNTVDCEIEDIPLHLETIHGAAGFDQPGGAVQAAAKLICRLGLEKLRLSDSPLLIHESGQGFFPCFLLEFIKRECSLPHLSRQVSQLVLSGRNILALEAARHNYGEAGLIPTVDLRLGANSLREATHHSGRYSFIAAFPELLPQSSLPKGADQLASLWEALPPLLTVGSTFIAAFGSTDAERFDRKKPSGFTRLGDIKRKGFRALAYRSG